MPDDKKDPEAEDVRNKPIATEDKVLIGLLVVMVLVIIAALRWVLTTFFGVAVGAMSGVGFRTAFFISLGLSFCIISIFAIIAGDGVLGELTSMIIGFFLMLVFFTFSIAILL